MAKELWQMTRLEVGAALDVPPEIQSQILESHKTSVKNALSQAGKTRETSVYGMPGVVQSGRGKRRKRHHI